MKKTRIAKLEKQQVATTGPELELVLNFTTEEERAAAQAEYDGQALGPLKMEFKIQEDSVNAA